MANQANRMNQVNTTDRVLQLIQSNVASVLQPLLTNPLSRSQLIENVQLSSGLNIVNHTLGRKLRGWMIVRLRGPASTWDSQDTNTKPNLTLLLNSSAAVSVDLMVF